MASSIVKKQSLQPYATLVDSLEVPEPAAATVLPADAITAEELEFGETDVISLFKKQNYKVHMCVRIASNMSKLTGSVIDTGAGRISSAQPSSPSIAATISAPSITCLSSLH